MVNWWSRGSDNTGLWNPRGEAGVCTVGIKVFDYTFWGLDMMKLICLGCLIMTASELSAW